jgi:hypothetical protein
MAKVDPLMSAYDSHQQPTYFTFFCAFFLSAQYFFIRSDTALRAAADIVQVR